MGDFRNKNTNSVIDAVNLAERARDLADYEL